MDEIELRIVDRIESHKSNSHDSLSEELRVYERRLAGLDLEERFNTIRTAAPEAVDEFMAEASQGRNELFLKRRHVRECEAERDEFRERHRIRRVSRQSGGGKLALKIGLLMALAVLEVFMNGAFLSKGSEGGLIGGIVEAVGFAVLNILATFVIAWGGVRWINHRNWFAKLMGAASLAFYVVFAISLNLALAHYREVSGTLFEDAGREVMARLRTDPMGIDDMKSWLFFGIGLSFSVIAFIDTLLMFDPYPGFGPLQKRVDAAHEDYNALYEDLVAKLEEILENSIESMKAAGKDLSMRRGEHDAILQGRTRLLQLFASHQDNLERAVNTLLALYREANVRYREHGTAPERFKMPYRMDRIPAPRDPVEAQAPEELRKRIERAQEMLVEQQEAIRAEFKKALLSYKEIDRLFPENENGTQKSQLKVA